MSYQIHAVHTGTPFVPDEDGTWTFARTTKDPVSDLVYIKTMNTAGTVEVHIASKASNYQNFIKDTGIRTCFPVSDGPNGTWLIQHYELGVEGYVGDDLIYIKTRNTDSKHVEIHVAYASSNYLKRNKSYVTCWPLSDVDNGVWTTSDKGDLIYTKTQNTGSNTVEVHIISRASAFKEWVVHTGTCFPVRNNQDGTYVMASYSNDAQAQDYPDLWYIKTRNTGTNMVEVHCASAKSKWQSYLTQTGTALPLESEDNGYWMMGRRVTGAIGDDWTGEYKELPDLMYIKTRNTDTKMVEVHIIESGGGKHGDLYDVAQMVTSSLTTTISQIWPFNS